MRVLPARGRMSGDTGSMSLALLLTLVGVMLSAAMLPMVVNQIGSTRNSVQRSHALTAAQTGIDVALGHIRSAVDGSGAGVLASLPCGPFSGQLVGGGAARYQVSVDYLMLDPKGQPDSWVTTNRMPCAPGTGVSTPPAFALLRSLGTDQPVGGPVAMSTRNLRGTYVFSTQAQTVAGGLIHVYKTALSSDLCLDAGSATPSAGTNVQLRPCSTASAQQTFSYNSNLTIGLVSSRTTAMPLGLCLDAGTPHVATRIVAVQPCTSTTVPQQQWIFNANANFEGTADGTAPDTFCFNVQNPNVAGSLLILGSVARATCRGAYDLIQTFMPEAGVGTGAAGAAAKQLVNLNQFSRCLTVTNQRVGSAYMINNPCQQATYSGNVTWDQVWTLPTVVAPATSATGRIITTAPGGSYCLRSPGSIAARRYVRVARCPAGATPRNMSWTVYRDTGTYASSYRIQDGYGYCLSPTDPTALVPDLHPTGIQISKMVVATCSASTLQKWNVPASVLQALVSSSLKDVAET